MHKPLAILPLFAVLFLDGSTVSGGAAGDNLSRSSRPGWQEQYLRMKRNSGGVIPAGVTRRIAAQQALTKTRVSNLTGVQFIGPTNFGGRTRALLIDRKDPSHFIAAGVSGGVWHSYDKGLSWQAVDDQAPTLSVTCLDQAALDLDILYYGTGEPVSNSAGIPGDGLFKSSDGGQSFSRLSASPASFDNIWSVKASMTDTQTVFVGTADGGLYRSTDGGASFEVALQIGTRNVEDIEVFADGKVMATVNGNGIFVSPAGAPGTFVKTGTGLPASAYYRVELAYCDSFPDVMYASFENGSRDGLLGVWKSTDGGLTWTKKWNDALNSTYYFPWYALMLGVKPDNPDIVVSGCVWADYSTDGGTTWSDVRLSHADHHVIRFDRDDNAVFYVGSDGGVYEYNIATAGSTFKRRNTGYSVTQFYAGAFFPVGTDLFGGTQDNATLASRSGSGSFQDIDPYNGDGSFTQINQQNPNIAYISWQYGRIRRTDDALSTYPGHVGVKNELDTNQNGGIDDGAWFNNPFEMNRNDGDQLFFVTYKRLWRTNNGAASWSRLTSQIGSSSASPYAIGISNDVNPTVYVGGEGAMLYRIDNARTAPEGSEANLSTTVPAAVTNDFIGNITVHPSDPSAIYVSFSNFSTQPRLYRVDNATTAPVWTAIGAGLPQELPVNWVEADPANPDSFLVAATDFGLYTTVDGGATWTHETAIPNVSIHQVRLRHSDRKLFIFTHGRGVWTADLADLSSGISEVKEWTVGVYPNPTGGELRISNIEQGISNVELRLYDSRGRQAMIVGHYASDSGLRSSDLHLNISHLSPGVYILQIKADGKLPLTQRIVKL